VLSADCLVKSLPFEKAAYSSLSNVDLEVTSHEESSHELEVKSLEFRKGILNIQQTVECLNLVLEAFVGALETCQRIESVR
jgi:hypothetical protein